MSKEQTALKTITSDALLRAGEIEFEFFRSPGPGGQTVNKVSTGVRLRFDVGKSQILPEAVKARLIRLAGRRMTKEGVLVIQALRFRTQERNREDALARLLELIRRAWEEPKERQATKPTAASKDKRLEAKRRRGLLKRDRRRVEDTGE